MPPLRLVICFVGLTLLGSLLGIVVLAGTGHEVPDILTTLAVSSLTGLLGLLVRPARDETPGP